MQNILMMKVLATAHEHLESVKLPRAKSLQLPRGSCTVLGGHSLWLFMREIHP